MALLALTYLLLLLWLVVHALHRLWLSRTDRAASGILPSHGGTRRRSSAYYKVVLKHVYLKIDSTRYNDAHDRLAMSFTKARHALWKRAAFAFYDVGSICGVLGILAALYVTASTMLWVVRVFSATAPIAGSATRLGKRDLLDENLDIQAVPGSTARDAPIHLIVPGVTLPVSHLPMLVIALFVSQVIHEAGHAITAAMESLPLLSVGASLTLILPSAYVSLPAKGIEALSPRARLRVISAGAFHNLVLWILLAGVSALGIGSLLWPCLGYRDVRSFGRVVVSINEASPLDEFLPLGAVVTKLDDTPLASTRSTMDPWQAYLNTPNAAHHREELGWCVDIKWFKGNKESCCILSGSNANVSCFAADPVEFEPGEPTEKCVPTLDVLRPDSDDVRRCAASADCHDGDACVTLREDQHITRIEFVHDREEKTVVWSGPLEELFEDVETSAYLPRLRIFPLWLPSICATAFSYVSTLSLSLFLFNLLPLPFLDGSQLLDAVADLAHERASRRKSAAALADAELGASRPATSGPTLTWTARYRQLKKALQASIGLMLLVTICAALRRSVL